jgi:acyl-CoA synthetase (NDP forming)
MNGIEALGNVIVIGISGAVALKLLDMALKDKKDLGIKRVI